MSPHVPNVPLTFHIVNARRSFSYSQRRMSTGNDHANTTNHVTASEIFNVLRLVVHLLWSSRHWITCIVLAVCEDVECIQSVHVHKTLQWYWFKNCTQGSHSKHTWKAPFRLCILVCTLYFFLFSFCDGRILWILLNPILNLRLWYDRGTTIIPQIDILLMKIKATSLRQITFLSYITANYRFSGFTFCV